MGETPTFDRFPYPRRLVVGVLRAGHDLQPALEGLERAGFGPKHRAVLHGTRDADSLDTSGDQRGLRGIMIRALQAASSDDLDHVRRHEEHLRAGDYVLAVFVGEDEDAKQQAAAALRTAAASFINYYADNYIESLDVDDT